MSHPNEQLAREFAKYLSRHGHGFQYAVIKYLKQLMRSGPGQMLMIDNFWQFLMSELPVESEKGTRVDFVLEREARGSYKRLFIVGECKRANPATANWCFAKSPHSHRAVWGSTEYVHLECVKNTTVLPSSREVFAVGVQANANNPAYHLAFALRTNEKGDPDAAATRQSEVEDAMAQALRGANGLVMHFVRRPQLLGDEEQAGILPAVFTTANLYTSDLKLDEAELATGKVDGGSLTRAPWVMCQYAMSPGLKHAAVSAGAPRDLVELYQTEYIRTVPVVSVEGIREFMMWASSFMFEMR
jgi:hypothetical protein